MTETFIFYVVTERAIPQSMGNAQTADRIQAIAVALAAAGSEVGRVSASIEQFAHAFEQIGEAMSVDDMLAQGAIAASPHDLLDDDDANWRMGFFAATTAAIIEEELLVHRGDLDQLGSGSAVTVKVRDQFLAAVSEAAASGQCIVIIHDRA